MFERPAQPEAARDRAQPLLERRGSLRRPKGPAKPPWPRLAQRGDEQETREYRAQRVGGSTGLTRNVQRSRANGGQGTKRYKQWPNLF